MKYFIPYLLPDLLLGFVGCSSEDDSPDNGNPNSQKFLSQVLGFISPASYEDMNLVWEDNFNGNSLDLSSCSHETTTGQNGWGNNELQYYSTQNTSVEGGNLIITATKECFSGRDYTSSRKNTQNKKQFRYGSVDLRAVMPKGQGLWPALWMLGSNFNTVGLPACGEIDIMEMIGGQGREKIFHGSFHWQQDGNRAEFGGEYSLTLGTLAVSVSCFFRSLESQFHSIVHRQ